MQGGLYNKFQQPISFSLSNQQTSVIKYCNIDLYYTKFRSQPFSALTTQYNYLTNSQMVIIFHGLIIKPQLLIQEIIETEEEQRVFQYVINSSHLSELTIAKKWCQPFNKIIHRIIKSGLFSQQVNQNDEIIDNRQQKHFEQFQHEKIQQKQAQLHKNEMQKQKKEQIINTDKINNKAKQQNFFSSQKIPKLLIYWVDDEPKNNLQIIEKQLKINEIEVKQVTSTHIMIDYLQAQYDFQKSLGRTILFISDMARQQNNKMNYQAGIDLFEHIYHKKKLTDPGIAFVNNKQQTKINMIKRRLDRTHIKILNEATDLVALIKDYVMKVKK